jgi:hypothetical protein
MLANPNIGSICALHEYFYFYFIHVLNMGRCNQIKQHWAETYQIRDHNTWATTRSEITMLEPGTNKLEAWYLSRHARTSSASAVRRIDLCCVSEASTWVWTPVRGGELARRQGTTVNGLSDLVPRGRCAVWCGQKAWRAQRTPPTSASAVVEI